MAAKIVTTLMTTMKMTTMAMMTAMINVYDTHMLVFLRQWRLGTVIIGGIGPP